MTTPALKRPVFKPAVFKRAWAPVLATVAAVLVLLPIGLMAAADEGLLNGAVQRLIAGRLHRPVSMQRLYMHLLTPHPSITISGLRVGSPRWAGGVDLLQVREITARVRWAPLLIGRLEPTDLVIDQPVLHMVRKGPGKDNWTFGKGGSLDQGLKSARRVVINDGRFDLKDSAGDMTLGGRFGYDPSASAPFTISAQGVLKAGAVTLDAKGTALNGRARGAPYPFTADVTDGETHVAFKGTSVSPLDFSGFDLGVQATGPNLADMNYLFGLLTPNSPPYQVTARVQRKDAVIQMNVLKAKIGGSDVSGVIKSDHSAVRRVITAAFRSDTLRLQDLQALIVAPPAHALARSTSGAGKPAPHPSARLFSDTPFQIERMREADADLSWRVGQAVGDGLNLTDLNARMTLKGGRFALTPVTFGLSPGRFSGALHMDGSRPVPELALSGSLQGVRLGALHTGLARTIDGTLDLWADLHGTGKSPQAVAASIRGRTAFRLSQGALQRSKAAALSGDLVQAVGLSLGNKAASTPLTCAIGEISADSGNLQAQKLVIVTGVGAATGSGGVNLRTESVDLTMRGQPLRYKALDLNAPVSLKGPLRQPQVKVETGQALKKAGVKGVISLIAAPFASALPTQTSREPQPDCQVLLKDAAGYVDMKTKSGRRP